MNTGRNLNSSQGSGPCLGPHWIPQGQCSSVPVLGESSRKGLTSYWDACLRKMWF